MLDLIRTRKGLKWGVPAMLLAGPYLAIAFWCTMVRLLWTASAEVRYFLRRYMPSKPSSNTAAQDGSTS